MMQPYPLNPVVTSDPSLTSKYNAHPASDNLISACLSPDRVEQLLKEGAQFETMVFINGEGEALINQIGDVEHWDNEFMPRIERLKITTDPSADTETIHRAITGDPSDKGMG